MAGKPPPPAVDSPRPFPSGVCWGVKWPSSQGVLTFVVCQAPCDYIPKMSYPLLQAREVLRLLAEEGIEGSVKEAEQRGDGV